jgi:hypothetical protein
VQLLKDITVRKVQILDDAKTATWRTAFQMVDMYIAKSIDSGYGASALGAYSGYVGWLRELLRAEVAMAGSNPGFNAAGFRNAIKTAMQMGAPPNEGERATFHFPVPARLQRQHGRRPGAVRPDRHRGVHRAAHHPGRLRHRVLRRRGQPTAFGLIAPSRIAVTVLDVDYDRSRSAPTWWSHGDRYDYRRTEPPNGLFDVGVYTMHFTSNSET